MSSWTGEEMSYQSALEATGAKVLEFQEFGSYQGSWYAIIFHEDKVKLIGGSYGSCSGCDAFQSEFDYDADRDSDYQTRLKNFGLNYLNEEIDLQEEYNRVTKDAEWDSESTDILPWLEQAQKLFFHNRLKEIL